MNWFSNKHIRIVRSTLVIAILVWGAVAVFGFVLLFQYSATSYGSDSPLLQWPQESCVERDPARANLVMLAHPRCPCTRASVAELTVIMERCQGLVTAHVLFLKPADHPESWVETDVWRTAHTIPGVRVMTDVDGALAKRFGAKVSGHVVLYDCMNHLVFSGGITGAREHRGDNAGRQAVIDLLMHGHCIQNRAPVFGCPLVEPVNTRRGTVQP